MKRILFINNSSSLLWLLFVAAIMFGPAWYAAKSYQNYFEDIQASKATVLITSKDSDQMLSVKSAELPRKGDRISVDQYTYGTASVGDTVCVEYTNWPDYPQAKIKFLSQGACQK